MGLANLLKRKVTRLKTADKSIQRRNDRSIEEKISVLAGKNSRTARRKLRQLMGRRSQPEDISFPNKGDERSVDSDKSNSHEEGRDVFEVGVHSLADSTGQSAYETLLASLAENNNYISQAYRQRQKELQGDSDVSDSSDSSDYGERLQNGGFLNQASGDLETNEDSEDDSEDETKAEDRGRDMSMRKTGSSQAKGDGIKSPVGNEKHDVSLLNSRDYYGNTHFEHLLTEEEIRELTACCANGEGSGLGALYNTFHDVEDSNLQAVWERKARLQASRNLSSLPRPPFPANLSEYGVKERLISRWHEMHSSASSRNKTEEKRSDWRSSQQQHFFALLATFRDIVYPCHPYPKSPETEDLEMDAILLHILNHIFQNADKIKKNNERLKTKGNEGDAPRDQGFTRPKVLILLPLRNQAFKVIQRLLALAVHETRTDSIQNKERFVLEYGPSRDDIDEANNAAGMEPGNDDIELHPNKKRRGKSGINSKPQEHQTLFWGNIDDHFRLGIKITKGAVRLYADFYQSDILVASPLALATKIAESSKDGGTASDFLSSIEILVLDRADVMLMQNWAHVQSVVKALNHLPREQHDADIMRVREWYLAGHSRYYRQTIILSSFMAPEFNSLVTKECLNYAGRVRWLPQHRSGVMKAIAPGVRQIFERVGTALSEGSQSSLESAENDPDARFNYFTSNVWPRIREASRGGGQLLYIPSYFDYVRVRNFLRGDAASFAGVCEYTKRSEMARSRTFFADGRVRVLLYTERAQFYNRHRIRGIKDIFFYQLPEHPQFYLELINYIEEDTTNLGTGTVTVLFSKFDALRLQRVVGVSRSKNMIQPDLQQKYTPKSKKNMTTAGTFIFC